MRWALIVLLIAFVTSAMAWLIFPSVRRPAVAPAPDATAGSTS